MQSKYLNTSYLYSSLNTLNIYFKKYTSFFFIFKCRLVSKLLDNLRQSQTLEISQYYMLFRTVVTQKRSSVGVPNL